MGLQQPCPLRDEWGTLPGAIWVTKVGVGTPYPHHPVSPCPTHAGSPAEYRLSPCPPAVSCPGSGGLPGLRILFLLLVAARLAALRSPYCAKCVLVQFSLPC